MSTLLIAFASIVLSVAAQFCLKAGVSAARFDATAAGSMAGWLTVALNPIVITGFLLYGASAVVWLSVLSRWDVSKAYPLVGIGFALTAVVGFVIGEHVTIARALGIGLIGAGVWLVVQN